MLAHPAIHRQIEAAQRVASREVCPLRHRRIQPRRYNRTVSTTPEFVLDPAQSEAKQRAL